MGGHTEGQRNQPHPPQAQHLVTAHETHGPALYGARPRRVRYVPPMGARWPCFVAVLALCTAACAEDVRLNFTAEAPVISTLVVLIDDEGPRAWAVQTQPMGQLVPQGAELDLYVLQYEHSLLALGLVEGPLAFAQSFEGSEPLPPTDRLRYQRVVGGQAGAAEPLDAWPPELEALRLPSVSVPDCLAGGGCLGPRVTDDSLVCKIPCIVPDVPDLPAAPQSVDLGPCPMGWVATPPASDDDIMECEPWAMGAECAVGLAQRPGEPSCTPVGEPCPVGAWPETIPSGAATYYVDAAATGFSDGSQTAPFAALSSVPSTTTGTTVIVLAAGTYAAPSALPEAVHIVGRCVSDTQINGLLTLSDEQVTLQNLSSGPIVQTGGRLSLLGVEVNSRRASSILSRAGRLVADDLLITHRGTGPGLSLTGAVDASVLSAQVSDGGVRLEQGAQLSLRDSVIESAGIGVELQSGARAALSRVVVRRSQFEGLRVSDEDTELTVDQVIIDAETVGLSSAVIRRGGQLSGRALSIRGAKGRGLHAETNASVDLQDLLIRDTGPYSSLALGAALDISDDAEVNLVRAHLSRCHTYGVHVDGTRTSVSLTDVKVIETKERLSDRELGTGVRIINGATATAQRLVVERTHGLGVEVRTGGRLLGSDVTVQDTLPRDRDGAFGRGMEATASSSINLQRLLIDGAHNIAIHILDEDATATLRDLTITNTKRSDCREFSCNTGVADGLTASVFADVDVQGFLIDNNGQYGVRVLSGSRITLKNGTISRNPVGAQIISENFDLRLLANGVRFTDNVVNVSVLAEQ